MVVSPSWTFRYALEALGTPWTEISLISEHYDQILIGMFYALALIGAATRLTLQIKMHQRLQLDDCLLLNAGICLTISTILGFVYVDTLYRGQELNMESSELDRLLRLGADLTGLSNAYRMLCWTYTVLLWSAIFSIKFAYLVFFRQLVDRLRSLVMYWRLFVGITVLAFLFCAVSCFLPCTEQGVETGKQFLKPASPVHH